MRLCLRRHCSKVYGQDLSKCSLMDASTTQPSGPATKQVGVVSAACFGAAPKHNRGTKHSQMPWPLQEPSVCRNVGLEVPNRKKARACVEDRTILLEVWPPVVAVHSMRCLRGQARAGTSSVARPGNMRLLRPMPKIPRNSGLCTTHPWQMKVSPLELEGEEGPCPPSIFRRV